MENTQTTAAPQAAQAHPGSFNVSELGVPVTITAETSVASKPAVPPAAKAQPDFTPRLSVERAQTDDQPITAKTRAEYVTAFKIGVEQTARATLEMCRVVYEANKTLDGYEFANFCREIGLKDWSSTVRKFIAIGKVYPRFIQYADQLPASWTNIYLITQIPADAFNQCLEQNYPLKELKGRDLAELLDSTKDISDINASLPFDKKNGGYVFARVMFTKLIDDVDWRAMRKAFAEVEARLPIKILVQPEAIKIVEQRKHKRYEATKQHHKNIELKPDLWDFGKEANAMYLASKAAAVVSTTATTVVPQGPAELPPAAAPAVLPAAEPASNAVAG